MSGTDKWDGIAESEEIETSVFRHGCGHTLAVRITSLKEPIN